LVFRRATLPDMTNGIVRKHSTRKGFENDNISN
jgi:hypothetical protein